MPNHYKRWSQQLLFVIANSATYFWLFFFRDNIEAVSPELKMPCGRGIFSILPVIILLAVMFAAMVSESSK